MYKYPVAATGTAQDLLRLVIQAGERALERDGTVLPAKSEAARAWLEPSGNLAGRAAGRLLETLPADAAFAVHDALCRGLAGGRSQPFAADSPVLARAAAAARELEAACGRPAALLALVAHPPVLGEAAALNFELARHAALALRSIRGRGVRPRLLAAVDLFALDTAGLLAEAVYAGFVGSYHLGLDRLSLGRGRLSAALLKRAAWPGWAWRLLERLRGGQEVILAPAGGVPATARILYTAREWIAAQRRRSPRRARPAEVLGELRRCEEFRRFESEGPLGPGLRRNAWRMLEGWAMSAVADAAESGALGERDLAVLRRCLQALGLPADALGPALAELREQWPRQTPWRVRLWRTLAQRVLARGQPLLFLPVVLGPSGVELRDAWAWRRGAPGRVFGRVLSDPPRDWAGRAEDFARDFIRAGFA